MQLTFVCSFKELFDLKPNTDFVYLSYLSNSFYFLPTAGHGMVAEGSGGLGSGGIG